MTKQEDLCPNSVDGNHRYFLFKTAEVFLPYNSIDSPYDEVVYRKVEQAVLGCNCGSVIKTEVK